MRLARVNRSPGRESQLAGEAETSKGSLGGATVEESFLEIHQRLHRRLNRYAERFVSRDDAFDAVGDVWLSIWRRWPSLAHDKRNDRYFFGAVHKRIGMLLRKNRELVSLDEAEVELDRRAMSAACDTAQAESLAEVLDESLAALSPRRREVLLLVKREDLTHPEAGEVLGVSVNTINTHVRVGRAELRAAFRRAAAA